MRQPPSPKPTDRPIPADPARPRSRWHQPVVRRLVLNVLLCIVIALMLTLVFRGGFANNLVFSLCIGLSIQGLIESGRYAIAGWRRRRGDDSAELRSGWPGWRYMGAWVLLSALLGHTLGTLLGGWLTGTRTDILDVSGNLRGVVVVLSITLIASIAFSYYFFTQGRLSTAQAQAQAAERLASEHELKLLQSQLEPHMLFNTLANLRVLIGLDAERAQTMLDHVVAYLRATLNASRQPLHPLRAEFDRLSDYLALMAVRMGPRLQVQLDLPDELADHPVPPLLLQPLVENSIQHGLEPKVGPGHIRVSARRQGNELVLSVRDTGVGLSAQAGAPTQGTGFGTAQVRERLQVLYGRAGHFSIAPAPAEDHTGPGDGNSDCGDNCHPGGTLALIRLPWAEPAAPGATAEPASSAPTPQPAPERS